MSNFQRIDANQAFDLIQQQLANVVDIRDEVSFSAGHIKDAQLLHNGNVDKFISAADKSLPLIVCCYHGNSSQNAAGYFAAQGFTNAFSLEGGYEVWKLQHPDYCE